MTIRAESKEPTTLKAIDLFPGLDSDIDRRIAAAETRLKFWIVMGVLTNLLIGLSVAIPLLITGTRLITELEASMDLSLRQNATLSARGRWMDERMEWENSAEPYLDELGWKRPLTVRSPLEVRNDKSLEAPGIK